MRRREFLRGVMAGAAGVMAAGLMNPARVSAADAPVAAAAGAANLSRPNIVLILSDDQGWRDASYQGSPVVKTPALDAIAAGGVRFDYFYPAQQMCSPGRFGLLTGRTPFRTGLHHLGAMRPEEITLAEALRTAEYHTGHFGKWHLGGGQTHPTKKGFEVSYYSPNYFDIGGRLHSSETGESVEVKGDSSVFTAELAINWMKKAGKDGKPFFAYVCFGSPHSPHKGAPELVEKYKGEAKADYWAEVAGVDKAVGKIRDELKTMGVADNTLLFFCSDNGGTHAQTLDPSGRGKGAVGVRTIACMEWPAKVKQPIRTDMVTTHMDFYPTVLEITGVKMPNQPVIDGVSLVPLLEGKMKERPKPAGFMLWNGQGDGAFAKIDFVNDPQAVWIDGRYKLVHTPEGHKGGKKKGKGGGNRVKYDVGDDLFDIYADQEEKNNLAAKMPEQVAKMRAAMEAWQKSVRDSFDGKDYSKAK